MAPTLIKNVLDSSIWTALDASQPKLSRRYLYNIGISPAVYAIPLAIAVSLILLGCCLRAQRANAARARNEIITPSLPRDLGPPAWASRPQAAAVPPPVSGDVLDPPPPYVPLQTLAPAHKPVNDILERPADTERNVGNHGQVRSTPAI